MQNGFMNDTDRYAHYDGQVFILRDDHPALKRFEKPIRCAVAEKHGYLLSKIVFVDDNGLAHVHCEDHPFNSNRAYSPAGIKGKPYFIGSILQLLIDSRRALEDGMGWLRRKTKEDEVFAVAPKPQRTASHHLTNPRVLCRGCDTKDPSDIAPNVSNSNMVCSKCGTEGAPIFVSLYREKNCTEDEDKTIRADRPMDKRSRFEQPASSREEARMRRNYENSGQNTFMSQKMRRKLGVGYAQERSEQCALNDALQHRNMTIRGNMDAKEQNREAAILHETNELIKQLDNIHDRVAACLRRRASETWLVFVQHTRVCPSRNCALNLSVKGHKIIAKSVMCCVLRDLAHGIIEINEVEQPHVIHLNEKFQSLPEIDVSSAARSSVRAQVATLMRHDKVSPLPPCETMKKPDSEASQDVAIRRVDSSFSDMNEDSEIIKIRDNILGIHKSLSSQVPNSVKKFAIDTLGTSDFKTRLDELREKDDVLKQTNLQALSFAILAAGQKKHDEALGAVSTGVKLSTHVLQSLNMSASAVDYVTDSIADIFPEKQHAAANYDFDF